MIDPKSLREANSIMPEAAVAVSKPKRRPTQRELTSVEAARLAQLAMNMDFLSFLKRCMREICPGELFKKNWHHEVIAFQLEQMYYRGSTQRQIVCLPPRSLKSIMISVAYVAWLLGKQPTMKIMCVSYSKALAHHHAKDCRRIMETAWYREIFPECKVLRSAADNIRTSLNGGRYATSVGGSQTGFGADVIIIDDPLNAEHANSETERAKCINWFRTTLSSRLNNKTKGVILLVMQRIHVDDLAGYLIDTGDWTVLELQAIAEEDHIFQTGPGRYRTFKAGEALHPEREPLETLRSQARMMGSAGFAAQYQQRPQAVRGALVKAEWLKTIPADFTLSPTDKIVISWDCAVQVGVLNDYSVGIVAAVRRNKVYVLDVVRERLIFPDLKRRVIDLARTYRAKALLIEDTAAGASLIQALHYDPPCGVPTPQAIRPERNKVERLSAVSAQLDAGDLFLPADAPWLAAFKAELMAFPDGRHDDQVDALSQLMNWVMSHNWMILAPAPGTVPKVRPFFGIHDYDPDDPDLSPDFHPPFTPMC